MSSNAIEYFGMDTVERAVADYFVTHGVTEEVRDHLAWMEVEDSEAFFDMVSDFVDKKLQI